jgi:hypothetical protein
MAQPSEVHYNNYHDTAPADKNSSLGWIVAIVVIALVALLVWSARFSGDNSGSEGTVNTPNVQVETPGNSTGTTP